MIRTVAIALAVTLALTFAPAAVSTARGDEAALKEVNAKRAARGLRPYIYDAGLDKAAQACAEFRAARMIFGHCPGQMGDFAFVPKGVQCTAGGCAAYPDRYGWMSCCVYDSYRYAGAAWVRGKDGKRYMHIMCR